MLRQAFVIAGTKVILKEYFGNALGENSLKNLFNQIQESKPSSKNLEDVEMRDFFNYRVGYTYHTERDWLFLLITDLTDKKKDLMEQVEIFKKEFKDFFEELDDGDLDNSTVSIFQSRLDKIHNNLRPKISLVGFSGVGKTTISKLIRDDEIPTEHIATMTGDIQTVKIGKLYFNLWDNAGQESFKKLWPKFIKGSDAVLIVTDSTKENVEESKFFLDLWRDKATYAKISIIANKQDLEHAIPPNEISETMENIRTYAMVANNPDNRDQMIQIVANVLEVNAEISPLLKPIFDRDEKIKEAEEALMNEDFARAKELFQEISRISLNLGDNELAFEFHERSIQIGAILKPGPLGASTVTKIPKTRVKDENEDLPASHVETGQDLENKTIGAEEAVEDSDPPISEVEPVREELPAVSEETDDGEGESISEDETLFAIRSLRLDGTGRNLEKKKGGKRGKGMKPHPESKSRDSLFDSIRPGGTVHGKKVIKEEMDSVKPLPDLPQGQVEKPRETSTTPNGNNTQSLPSLPGMKDGGTRGGEEAPHVESEIVNDTPSDRTSRSPSTLPPGALPPGFTNPPVSSKGTMGETNGKQAPDIPSNLPFQDEKPAAIKPADATVPDQPGSLEQEPAKSAVNTPAKESKEPAVEPSKKTPEHAQLGTEAPPDSQEMQAMDMEDVKQQVISRINLVEKYIMDLEIRNLTGEINDKEFDIRQKKLLTIKHKLEKKLMTIVKQESEKISIT